MYHVYGSCTVVALASSSIQAIKQATEVDLVVSGKVSSLGVNVRNGLHKSRVAKRI